MHNLYVYPFFLICDSYNYIATLSRINNAMRIMTRIATYHVLPSSAHIRRPGISRLKNQAKAKNYNMRYDNSLQVVRGSNIGSEPGIVYNLYQSY
jgi:hypothetical protein